jgi:hypothetical protein
MIYGLYIKWRKVQERALTVGDNKPNMQMMKSHHWGLLRAGQSEESTVHE